MHIDLNGILIIDKPENMTSAKLVAHVKKTLNVKKVGHTGTLDPMATGVMICCLNKATRLARFFLHGQKTYDAQMLLGIETDTQDSTGNIVAENHRNDISNQQILSAIQANTGEIWQIPPVYSALKHKGTPLYKLARSGNAISKPARKVLISNIKDIEIKFPEVRFSVTCSAGTYIRTLCHDIGKTLECGGHLTSLRRTDSCGFEIHKAITLEELKDIAKNGNIGDYIVNMTDVLKEMSEYTADERLENKIGYGAGITLEDLRGDNGMVLVKDGANSIQYLKIIDHGRNLLAVLEYQPSDGCLSYCCVFNNY